jgi:hypothetical protein
LQAPLRTVDHRRCKSRCVPVASVARCRRSLFRPAAFASVALVLAAIAPLRAGEPTKNEKQLIKMEDKREKDDVRRTEVETELNTRRDALIVSEDKKGDNIRHYKANRAEVGPADSREKVAQDSYEASVEAHGQDDPGSVEARAELKDARQDRQDIKKAGKALESEMHDDSRQVHNEKTVILQQKRTLANESRYLEGSDRKIIKKKRQIKKQKTDAAAGK